MNTSRYKIIEMDPYLQPYEADINLRMERYKNIKQQLLGKYTCLKDFANGHLYYGFHKQDDGWIYREWAPNAESIALVGDFNNWNYSSHKMKRLLNGDWEIYIAGVNSLQHGTKVKIQVTANGRSFERIPLYAKRVVQDPNTHVFCAEIWQPENTFHWNDTDFTTENNKPLLIYESHIGMASEEGKIASYLEFAENILPKVKKCGYNTIQLMAIMEHPYYASFGYQVSNFFAPSSRFGTPDDLKYLINKAHNMGIAVLLDIVHSHAVCNTAEGINEFDGTDYQFFHSGEKGNHPAWGTKLFNYAKPEVMHFLLSNVNFWLSEYHFDGFRFDGVTSMLYHDHGLGTSFDGYKKYFDMNTDVDAITYLQFAAKLTKEIRRDAILIAEDMSGMPGMCIPIDDGGIGFDYRLAMGVPDYWVNCLKCMSDENWSMGHLWHELTQRRPGEKVIGYCESHDQALVGDKTIMFWLADKEMYWHMSMSTRNHLIDRAISLHKIIRLITCVAAGEGYLNFMGNEFGHPEWIDFPREGNGWSYHYCRRLWSLSEDMNLLYRYLLDFDIAMINLVKENAFISETKPKLLIHHEDNKILVFSKGNLLFLFNFHPTRTSIENIELGVLKSYKVTLNSEWECFGGGVQQGATDVILKKNDKDCLSVSIYPRSALVIDIN